MANKIHGVGINDSKLPISSWKVVDEGRKRVLCPYYRKWHNMLSRCYCSKYQDRQPTYKGCCVCQEWLHFSNFKKWMETQDWEGKQLDKDILGDGKIYSPESCCFVSSGLNKFMLNGGSKTGHAGVFYCDRLSKYLAQCGNPFQGGKREHLGSFVNKDDAISAWCGMKLKHLVTYMEVYSVDVCICKKVAILSGITIEFEEYLRNKSTTTILE